MTTKAIKPFGSHCHHERCHGNTQVPISFPLMQTGSAFLKDVISTLQGTVLHRRPRLVIPPVQCMSRLAASLRKRSVPTNNAHTRQSLEKVWLSRHGCRQMAPLLRHNVSKQCGASDAVGSCHKTAGRACDDTHARVHDCRYVEVGLGLP